MKSWCEVDSIFSNFDSHSILFMYTYHSESYNYCFMTGLDTERNHVQRALWSSD